MFTGLIQEIGSIKAIQSHKTGKEFVISAPQILSDAKVGDSISVNGVCSTITTMSQNTFSVDYMPESLNKTALGHYQVGDAVNLEACLTLKDKLGGHLVSGHIDTVGTLISSQEVDGWTTLTLSYPNDFAHLLIPKGSIAIDGISLTISDLTSEHFSVSLIPHTISHTTLQFKKAGDPINLEFDMIGKYLYRSQTLAQSNAPKSS